MSYTHSVIVSISESSTGGRKGERRESLFFYFDESVYSENDQFRLSFRVHLQVQVDEFLLFDIIRLHVLEYVGEQS